MFPSGVIEAFEFSIEPLRTTGTSSMEQDELFWTKPTNLASVLTFVCQNPKF